MLRGLYSAASGMIADITRLDVVSNNLANVGSAGFKREEVVQHSFHDLLLRRLNDRPRPLGAYAPPAVGYLGTGTYVDQVVTDFSSGNPRKTDNPFDLSFRDLPGEPTQFFAVQTPGGVRYTRTLNLQPLDGQILTPDGYPVLSDGGTPVEFSNRGDVRVDETGQVRVGDRVVDRLQVVSFAAPEGLRRQGAALYQETAASGVAEPVTDPRLLVGFEESSNVNPVLEMVNMIEIMRNYEAGSKAVQSQDATLEKLLQIQA
ncbi:MAG: flagellar hook-basal body protein [Bacillota bacterium]